MESVARAPESAIELIMKAIEMSGQASALVTAAVAAPETAALTGALGAVADALGETGAALRALNLTADVLLLARKAGAAEERERAAGAAPKQARHLALAAS